MSDVLEQVCKRIDKYEEALRTVLSSCKRLQKHSDSDISTIGYVYADYIEKVLRSCDETRQTP